MDGTNAFNTINKEIMLHNIQYVCPPMSVYAYNCYVTPSHLFIHGRLEISSSKGTTEGDSLAMPLYALAVTALLQFIKSDMTREVKQVAFADI